VDFQINFLVFESRDGGSFLQRLGRMGRHTGYTRNGQNFDFQDYRAYALVPGWIADRLFKGGDGAPPPLTNTARLNVRNLMKLFGLLIPQQQALINMPNVGVSFSPSNFMGIGAPTNQRAIQRNPRKTKKYLRSSIWYPPCEWFFYEYKELNDSRSPLLKDALSFRGGDEFPCCVIDISEPNPVEQFKNVDLLQMICQSQSGVFEQKRVLC